MVYNLNDNVADSFDFTLSGNTYTMRYPTLEEIQDIDKASKEAGANSDTVLDILYKFVQAKDSAPPLSQVMPKQNTKVISNFMDMIKQEFGTE